MRYTFLFLTMEQVLALGDFREEFVECFVVLYETLMRKTIGNGSLEPV